MASETARRRGRPALVTIEGIIEATLRLRPGSWTVAAVAESLGVSPQSIYRQVATVEVLLETVIDHVVWRGLVAPERSSDERGAEYLGRVARCVRSLLESNPGVALAAASQAWLGATPALDEFLERCLEQLGTMGVAPVDANIALDLVLDWTVSWVSRHEIAQLAGDTPMPSDGRDGQMMTTPLLDHARASAPDIEAWFDRQLGALTRGALGDPHQPG